MVWGLRRLGRRAWAAAGLRLVVGGAVVLVPAHLWAGRHVFDQLRHARIYVSLADPWRPVVDALSGPLGHQAVRHWVVLLAPIPVLVVAALLSRVVRPAANLRPPEAEQLDPTREAVVADAAVASVVLGAAYVLAAPYVLPWYDASVWAPLALVAGGALDAVLLVRLVAYALAYVPGLVDGMSPTVHDLTLGYRRQRHAVRRVAGDRWRWRCWLGAAVRERGDARRDDERDAEDRADGRDGGAGVVEGEADHPHDEPGDQPGPQHRGAVEGALQRAAPRTTSGGAARARRRARRPARARTGCC